ncbi:hypothetical protein [Chitinophaga varians]|uniref:hypothetical protein n=1 Tax=Chitinophaga varians TaxID=2202339 RepID=UPI00165FF9BE|nr:hypothetical protein [Chitinophaga varians]MBC9909098.1 hypothetical protein [Chitinophaga varians]
MNEMTNQTRFEFDKRLDSSLYITFELKEIYAVDVFESFINSIQKKLADLENAILKRDVDRISILLHTYVSNYNYVGLSFIAGTIREMKSYVNAENWEQVEYLMTQVKIQTETFSPVVREELKRLKTYLNQ